MSGERTQKEHNAHEPPYPHVHHQQPTLRILTVREAAAVLQINEAALRRLLRSGELRGSRVGRLWRIRIEAIEELLDANSTR